MHLLIKFISIQVTLFPPVGQVQGKKSSQSPKSKVKRGVLKGTTMRFVPTQPGGVVIRAPPPMVGNCLQNRGAFRPPGRTSVSQYAVVRDAGQKFVAMKDLHEP